MLFAFLALPLLVLAACAARPSDDAQIRALARDEAAAVSRADWRALYRLYHPDYRAICPFDAFRAAQRPDDARLLDLRELEIRHDRATATVRLVRTGAQVDERRAFVEDAGRWYLYATSTPCE